MKTSSLLYKNPSSDAIELYEHMTGYYQAPLRDKVHLHNLQTNTYNISLRLKLTKLHGEEFSLTC